MLNRRPYFGISKTQQKELDEQLVKEAEQLGYKAHVGARNPFTIDRFRAAWDRGYVACAKSKPLAIREIQTHRLEMLASSPHPGLNITVRGGDYWLKARPGDRCIYRTDTYDYEQQFRGTVVISAVRLEPGECVPDSLLRFNHAPGARTREGLNAGMIAAYGTDWESKPVVILSFWA